MSFVSIPLLLFQRRHKEKYKEEDYYEKKRDSDLENRQRQHHEHGHKKGHPKRRHSPSHVKQEPDSDDGHIRVKRERSEDRHDRRREEMHRQRKERRHHERRREERRERSPFPANNPIKEEAPEPVDKDKPNFALSGKLTEETNTFRGVVIKYSEPPEARKPRKRWRFYPFKGEEALPVLHISRQSAYLLGRDRKIADMPIDHPSCSKQHAALQYRLVEYERPDGTIGRQVRPYIIDLESANGTYVNNKRIDAKRYVELQEKDVVKFGFSTREYVLLHDKTSTDELQDSEEGSET